jgi:hypothetical protein
MADGTITIPGIGETKKTYVYVGLAVVAGGVGYAWWSYKRAADAGTVPADGTTYSPDYAGLSGGGAAGTTTSGLGGGDSGGSTVTDPDLLPPTTNIEWSTRVTKILTEKFGYDGQLVGSAIGKYLARIGLNTAEQDLIRTAWGQLGRPPQGDFPIIPVSTTQPPPDTTPPPSPQYTPEYTLSVAPGSKVDAFTAAIRSRSGKDIDWGLLEATNGSLAGNINWGPSGSKDFASRTFKKSDTYKIPSVPR